MERDSPVKVYMTRKLIGVKHMLIEDDGKIVGIFSLSDLLTASRRRLETAIAAE